MDTLVISAGFALYDKYFTDKNWTNIGIDSLLVAVSDYASQLVLAYLDEGVKEMFMGMARPIVAGGIFSVLNWLRNGKWGWKRSLIVGGLVLVEQTLNVSSMLFGGMGGGSDSISIDGRTYTTWRDLPDELIDDRVGFYKNLEKIHSTMA